MKSILKIAVFTLILTLVGGMTACKSSLFGKKCDCPRWEATQK